MTTTSAIAISARIGASVASTSISTAVISDHKTETLCIDEVLDNLLQEYMLIKPNFANVATRIAQHGDADGVETNRLEEQLHAYATQQYPGLFPQCTPATQCSTVSTSTTPQSASDKKYNEFTQTAVKDAVAAFIRLRAATLENIDYDDDDDADDDNDDDDANYYDDDESFSGEEECGAPPKKKKRQCSDKDDDNKSDTSSTSSTEVDDNDKNDQGKQLESDK